VLAACCGVWLLAAGAGAGGASGTKGGKEKGPKPGTRRAIGQVASPAGTVLLCEGPKKGCRALKPRAPVHPGDRLLALPGLRGDVELHKGAVRLSLLGHFPEADDSAVLESAVTLHAPDMADLDLALDRGRALVANTAAKGGVKIRVRFLKEVLGLDLSEPGSAVALELVSQWSAGTPFAEKPKAEHRPIVDGFLFVLKGPVNARLSDGTEQNGLRAGLVYHWNSRRGVVGPVALEKMPAWTGESSTPKGKSPQVQARLGLRERLAKQDVSAALSAGLRAKEPAARTLAVYSLGAVDDLPGVLRALADPKDRAARRAAVTALRHWTGLGPERDVRLYEALIKDGYKPVQAETVVGLLHGFTRSDLEQRETYETLIDYLGHARPAVRELAVWHLYRALPEAASIAYDALGPEAQRSAAQAAWRKLLRAGKLPPRPAPK
jgi:hypothetical protein